jgi:bifunctional DNA-binding transcriptional regulator/antitoxin component of YhaV-PrlF toxin-antitoxin module
MSPEYQVSIPREVCEILGIRPGQKFEILIDDGQMHFMPVEPIESLRGILKGCSEPFVREKQDRPP